MLPAYPAADVGTRENSPTASADSDSEEGDADQDEARFRVYQLEVENEMLQDNVAALRGANALSLLSRRLWMHTLRCLLE